MSGDVSLVHSLAGRLVFEKGRFIWVIHFGRKLRWSVCNVGVKP